MKAKATLKATRVVELIKENQEIRDELDNLIGLESPIYSPIWLKINNLIENELKLERYCNR